MQPRMRTTALSCTITYVGAACDPRSRGICCVFVALTHETPDGAMVQRLARGPFKAEIRVRFPLALPKSRV
jgi:hypothetical protein